MNTDPRLQKQVEQHPYPLMFATISGAHLYGFPSEDSDFDLRGAHRLPLGEDIYPLTPMTVSEDARFLFIETTQGLRQVSFAVTDGDEMPPYAVFEDNGQLSDTMRSMPLRFGLIKWLWELP